jgi:biopolymer transport protein ExbB
MMDLFMLAQATPAGTDDGTARTLWHYIEGGGIIGYCTIGCSIVAFALAIVQLVRVRSIAMAPPPVVEALGKYLADNDVQGAIRFCNAEENDSFLSRTFGAALQRCSRSPFGFLELRSALEEAGASELTRASRPNDIIALVATLAPMLGLLGTVVGMVGAFDTISTTQGSAKPADLAGNISLALITTVQGLVVAIPCHAIHHYFRNRLERCAGEVSAIAEGLAADFEASVGVKPAAMKGVPTTPAGAVRAAATGRPAVSPAPKEGRAG